MKLRKIKNGVWISPEIRLDAPLDAHNGIATYLATDEKLGNTLVSMFPESEGAQPEQLQKTVDFYRDVLHLETRCGKYEEFIYFSEPFPLGEYMFEWLERRERVSLAEAIKRVIAQLKILYAANERGLYHGRLTPKTILLERTNESFDLRMMGLGVSQLMSEQRRLDINWFDFTINLKGMNPQSVDIYGMAIILMGLVSGEQGIGSFEATGLLPPMLRAGHLQQTMERALALRMDAYTDMLTFTQDLEAALLELDASQGELYVGDLVGYESAVRNIANISDEGQAISENSGIWTSVVNNLEQEMRSSLLCSLTSLTAVKNDDGLDDDDTRVTSMPDSVLNLRRIHTAHATENTVRLDHNEIDGVRDERTVVTSSRPSIINDVEGEDEDDTGRLSPYEKTVMIPRPEQTNPGVESDKPDDAAQKSDSAIQPTIPLVPPVPAPPAAPRTSSVQPAVEPPADVSPMPSKSDFDDDEVEDEEEDDAPTRVMMRPNYQSIRFSQEEPQGVSSAIQEVLKTPDKSADAKSQMVQRIRDAEVVESRFELKSNVVYDPNDLLAFPFDPELEAREKAELEAAEAESRISTSDGNGDNTNAHASVDSASKSTEPQKSRGFTRQQRFILCVLTLVVFIMILAAIMMVINRV